ncbi:hypothetical protein VNI00_015076 [Paramarasmius palmivorus]|uniref:Uncharacterized protein n=1 Tax=Paramarasmius palmivorus TaxID=297713 RepID=A0AAW0BMS8_9AGAR
MGGKINLYYKEYSRYVPIKQEESDTVDLCSVPTLDADDSHCQGAELVSIEEMRLKVQEGRRMLKRGEKIDAETTELIRTYDENERIDQEAWERFCRWWEDLQARREARRIELLEFEGGGGSGDDHDGGDDHGDDGSKKLDGSRTAHEATADKSTHNVDGSA